MLTRSTDNSLPRERAPLWLEADSNLLEMTNQLIRANLSNEYFGANELSFQLGVSLSYLNRFLNEKEGMPAGKLIHQTRLKLAHKLVIESKIPFKNIAMEVGYVQQSNFTRAFVKNYQQTPTALRQKDQNKDQIIDWGKPLVKEEIKSIIRFLFQHKAISNGVKKLFEQIENPLFGVGAFAEACCLSTSQLNRILTKNLNTTTVLFIRNLKISYVCDGLLHSNKGIPQLIYSVNFFDVAYFNKCFKKIYKITPGAYRSNDFEGTFACLFKEIERKLKNDKLMHS